MLELNPMLMELNVWGGIGVLVGAFIVYALFEVLGDALVPAAVFALFGYSICSWAFGGLCPGIAGAIVCFIVYILSD
jgi:hypothetical protein